MIKRVKLDEFLIKEVGGALTLHIGTKPIYPKGFKLKQSDHESIEHTVESVLKHSAHIPFDFTLAEQGRQYTIEAMKLIFQELQHLQRIVDYINAEAKQLSEGTYRSIHVVPHRSDSYFTQPCAHYLHNKRKDLVQESPKGAVVVLTSTNVPYLDLTSDTDLARMYQQYIYVGKV